MIVIVIILLKGTITYVVIAIMVRFGIQKNTQDFLSFVSPRKAARSAEYTHVFPIQVAIFIPEAVAIPIEENINYCADIDLLPI